MPSSNRPSAEEMLSFYRGIMLIRRAEERLSREIPKGEIPGGVHLYIGEEAVAVGACAALEERDWITSTHRGHGHYLAKGGDLALMYAEIWGKRTGLSSVRCDLPVAGVQAPGRSTEQGAGDKHPPA